MTRCLAGEVSGWMADLLPELCVSCVGGVVVVIAITCSVELRLATERQRKRQRKRRALRVRQCIIGAIDYGNAMMMILLSNDEGECRGRERECVGVGTTEFPIVFR